MNYYNPIEQPARVRFMHGVENAQPVDIFINDRPIVRGLRYRQTTQYITLPSGQYNIKVYSSQNYDLLVRKNMEIKGSMLVTIEPKDEKLVLVVKEEKMMGEQIPGMMPGIPYGYQQQTCDQKMPYEYQQEQPYEQMMPYQQQPYDQKMPYGYQQQPCGEYQSIFEQGQYEPKMRDQTPKGNAKVRFAHFSPNAPAVDITLPNGTVLFRNVPYKAVTDYIDVAPGTYNLQVRPTGSEVVVLTIPNVLIRPNDVKTIHAIGLVNGTPPLEAEIITERM